MSEKREGQSPLFDGVIGRRSTPKLQAPAPGPLQLQRILQAAEAAPDHGLLRPWRFYIVQGDALIRLGEAFASAEGVDKDDERAVQKAKSMPLRAPLMVVITSACTVGGKYPELEQMIAVGAAVQNMQLVAHEEGFAAMWRTGAMAYDPHVRTLFNVAEHDQIIGFLYMGTAEKQPSPRTVESINCALAEHAFHWQAPGDIVAWCSSDE